MTPTKEITAQDFDSDAILNELFDCCKEEIPWNYECETEGRPKTGFSKFLEFLNSNLSQVRQQAFSAGRLQGLKEMDEAHTTVDDLCEVRWRGEKEHRDALLKIVTLRSEFRAK